MVGNARRRIVGSPGRAVRLLAAGLVLMVAAGCTAQSEAADAPAPTTAAAPTTAGAPTSAAAPATSAASVAVTVPPITVQTTETAAPNTVGDPGTTAAPVTSAPETSAPETSAPVTSEATTEPTTTEPTTTEPTTSEPPAEPVVKRIVWNFSLADQAAAVSPVAPISIAVADGTLKKVTLTNAEGEEVKGELAADGAKWRVEPELGYGKTYTLTATAVNSAGRQGVQTRTFTTSIPNNLTFPTAFPLDGDTVGVGQPVVVYFDEPISDKAAAEKQISVSASPKATGAFFWINDQEVRWRPKEYWKPGTKVDVKVGIYGHDLGNGLFGQADKEFSFSIGKSKIAYIDDKTKTMVVKFNGKVVKEIPVSLGSDQYPTYNGVHVVAEKYEMKIMDSSTWGLTGVGAYRTEVGWASRISSSGEFVHSAPWSVWAQGSENVSHGCVNVSEENAIWFYDNFGPGDIVDIKNTVGSDLQVWDGFGDWQLPWSEYKKGSAL